MPHYNTPDIDLLLVSEELDRENGISVEKTRGGLLIQVDDSSAFIFDLTAEETFEADISGSEDYVLVPVEAGFLEITEGEFNLHSLEEADSYPDYLKTIVQGETKGVNVDVDQALQFLGNSGYIHGYTPENVAEILAGWAVSDGDSVLDFATGSGTILEKAAEQNSEGNLTGVEIHPLIARLAKARVHGSSNAEIVESDFFEWNAPDQDGGGREFDAVVGNPPAGSFRHILGDARGEISEKYSYSGHRAAAAFVAKAVHHLKYGGKAAFLLPKAALDEELLDLLSEKCGVHRAIQLPVGIFHDPRDIEMVVLTLVKEERPSDVRETGIGKINQPELPENVRGLVEQPLDGVIKNRYDTYNADIVKASHDELKGKGIQRIISNPPIRDILASDGFTRFGDLEEARAGTGVKSGENDFFYFSKEEREESGIDGRFFRPLIKNPDNEIQVITEENVDQYVLDLELYFNELRENGLELTEDRVLEELEEDGYGNLADYLRDMPERRSRDGLRFSLDYRGVFDGPDLVVQAFFDDPRCYRVEVDDALFDSTVIGIQTESDEVADSLTRLFNTPLYRELFQTFARSMNVDWYRISITELRDIPIIEDAISREVYDRMEPFFPPEDDNDLVGLNQVLIESCSGEDEEEAVRRYLASRDDYAWSWLMTLPEFTEFQEILESENAEQAKEFVLNRFDEKQLDQARNIFNNIDFFEERRELLNDLLSEFEDRHYRAFLAGIVLQFEGVLSDLVNQAGGEILEDEDPPKFEMPGRGQKDRNLNELISHFFDGVFSKYLDETVRKRRNKYAHGGIIDDSEELSIHFFISFYALCNAAMNEYIRMAGETDSEVNA